MPITLGEIFTHAQLLDFKNRNSWAGPGAASVLVDHHVRSEPKPDLSSLASAVANCGRNYCCMLVDQLAKKTWKLIVEFVTTKRLVCKNGHSLVEPPSRVYTVSVSACLFVGERLFQKVFGRPLPSTSPLTLFAWSTEPQVVVLPLSHGLGRGENLVTIARFAKPLFANMHHHVHAVAGALRKPNVACPHPDVSTWPVWWWCDRRWVRTPQLPPFVDRTDFFFICTLR